MIAVADDGGSQDLRPLTGTPVVPDAAGDRSRPTEGSLMTVRRVALLTAGGFAPCLSSAIGGLIERYTDRKSVV